MTKQWLRDKLTEGKADVWQEPQTVRFDWRTERMRLVQPEGSRTAPNLADELTEVRRELRADVVIDLLSIRIRARDKKQRGKLVETWLRGSFLRRLIELPRPHRHGFSRTRYQIACGFLLSQGIAKHHPHDGGYVWHDDYRHMKDRAGWLVQLIRREGELRQVDGRYEYE